MRKRLCYDLLAYHTERLKRKMEAGEKKGKEESNKSSEPSFKRVQLPIGEHTIKFVDLREVPYQFIVNTIPTVPDELREISRGTPRFLQEVPYISASLIDNNMRGFASVNHHGQLIFAVHMVLKVPAKNMMHIAATDINCPHGRGVSLLPKLDYLQKLQPVCEIMDIREALYRLKILEKDKEREIPLSPYEVRMALSRDPLIKIPSPSRRITGDIPLYTIEGIKDATVENPAYPNSFTEAIIRRASDLKNPAEQTELQFFAVDEFHLSKYLERYNSGPLHGYATEREAKQAEESLKILSELSIPLVLIKTDPEGYKRKLPVRVQLENLAKEKDKLRLQFVKCHTQLARIERSRLIDLKIPEERRNQIKTQAETELARIEKCIIAIGVEQKMLVDLAKSPPRLTKVREAAKVARESNSRAGTAPLPYIHPNLRELVAPVLRFSDPPSASGPNALSLPEGQTTPHSGVQTAGYRRRKPRNYTRFT